MGSLLLVGIGGGFGAMSRFALTQATASISKQIPLGVLICNISGSLSNRYISCFSNYLIKMSLRIRVRFLQQAF